MSHDKPIVCPFVKTENACKICQSSEGDMESIFCTANDQDLLNKIFKCTKVKVSPVCGIISPICEFCRMRIDNFDENAKPVFKEYVIKTDLEPPPDNNDPLNALDPIKPIKAEQKTSCNNEEETKIEIKEVKQIKNKKTPFRKKIKLEETCSKRKTRSKDEKPAEIDQKPVQDELIGLKKEEPEIDFDNTDNYDNDNDSDWKLSGDEKTDGKSSTKKKKGRPKAFITKRYMPRMPVKCEICGKMVSYMRDHMRQHNEKKQHKCTHCGRTFSQKNNLIYHIRTHTGEKPYKCEYCEKSFICESHLRSHYKLHLNEQRYQCDICARRFNQAGNLKKHLRVHSGEKPYKCEICGKEFISLSNKKTHVRRHTGEKYFICEVCSRSFFDSHHLDRHMRTHTGEKPHVCQICTKAFSTPAGLKQHQSVHEDNKSYFCEYCKKTFSCSFKLKLHMRTHIEDKPNKCNMCYKTFAKVEQLDVHIKRVHTEIKPRKKKEIIINPEKALQQLESGITRPFRCETCFKNFHQAYNLKIHLRTHTGERPFKCEKCPRSFNQKEHLRSHDRTHTGEKPFECSFCREKFARMCTMKEHKKTVHSIPDDLIPPETLIKYEEPIPLITITSDTGVKFDVLHNY